MTCHLATNHSSSPHVTSQPSTLLHLTPQATSWHQNRSHHHHGTAEGSFTAKKWFGHRAGRSPCAHSIGKFFLCYIVLFLLETSAPGLSGHYWYTQVTMAHIQGLVWASTTTTPSMQVTWTEASGVQTSEFEQNTLGTWWKLGSRGADFLSRRCLAHISPQTNPNNTAKEA